MMNLMEEIGAALRERPRALLAALIVVVASLGMTEVFRVVDAALILPLPSANREQMVLAILVSRTMERSSPGHLHLRAKVRSLDEPAAFFMLAEFSVEGPSGVISVSGAWPTRLDDCTVAAQAEQRRAA
jgi:hypothetical protein